MFAFRHASWRPQAPPSTAHTDRDTYAHRRTVFENDADAGMDASEAVEASAIVDDGDWNRHVVTDDELMPLATSGHAQASPHELRERFARALSLQEAHAKHVAAMRLTTTKRRHDVDSSVTSTSHTRTATSCTRGGPVSINCETEKKLMQRRIRQRRLRERAELRAKLARLQQRVIEMKRSNTLLDSQLFLRGTNQSGRLVGICREYFAHFARGYDSARAHNVPEFARAGDFVRHLATPDLVCREYRGADKLLNQWEIYTRFHSDIRITFESVERVDTDDDVVSVWVRINVHLEVSTDTLKNLYPEFYSRAQLHAQSREFADSLVGKRYVFACDKVLHFDRHGKLFAHETKVHIVSGLLDMLRDPLAAVQVLDGSVKTTDGHWKTDNVDYIRESEDDMYTLPKYLL